MDRKKLLNNKLSDPNKMLVMKFGCEFLSNFEAINIEYVLLYWMVTLKKRVRIAINKRR